MKSRCIVNDCHIYKAISDVKSRYNAVIIFSLDNNDKSFIKIREEFDYMSNEQINRSLKNLINSGLVIKNYTYSLTPKGKKVCKVLRDLENIYKNDNDDGSKV